MAGGFHRRFLEARADSDGGHFLWYRDGNDLQQLVCPSSSLSTTGDPGQVFRKVATDLARGRIPLYSASFLFA